MWFNNRTDEGIIYSDLFDPMPVPAIALIITAVECSIDEWATGTNVDVAFRETNQDTWSTWQDLLTAP